MVASSAAHRAGSHRAVSHRSSQALFKALPKQGLVRRNAWDISKVTNPDLEASSITGMQWPEFFLCPLFLPLPQLSFATY